MIDVFRQANLWNNCYWTGIIAIIGTLQWSPFISSAPNRIKVFWAMYCTGGCTPSPFELRRFMNLSFWISLPFLSYTNTNGSNNNNFNTKQHQRHFSAMTFLRASVLFVCLYFSRCILQQRKSSLTFRLAHMCGTLQCQLRVGRGGGAGALQKCYKGISSAIAIWRIFIMSNKTKGACNHCIELFGISWKAIASIYEFQWNSLGILLWCQ